MWWFVEEAGACAGTTSLSNPDGRWRHHARAGARAPAGRAEVALRSARRPCRAITAVVDEFVARTPTDKRIKERFFNVDAVAPQELLVEFVCIATGGPCKYSGRDMQDSHAGMELVDEEFNALVEDLVGALDKFKVPGQGEGRAPRRARPARADDRRWARPSVAPDRRREARRGGQARRQLKDKTAADCSTRRSSPRKRGQRNYAEQLFSAPR